MKLNAKGGYVNAKLSYVIVFYFVSVINIVKCFPKTYCNKLNSIKIYQRTIIRIWDSVIYFNIIYKKDENVVWIELYLKNKPGEYYKNYCLKQKQ